MYFGYCNCSYKLLCFAQLEEGVFASRRNDSPGSFELSLAIGVAVVSNLRVEVATELEALVCAVSK